VESRRQGGFTAEKRLAHHGVSSPRESSNQYHQVTHRKSADKMAVRPGDVPKISAALVAVVYYTERK